jgi:hypothetical protein
MAVFGRIENIRPSLAVLLNVVGQAAHHSYVRCATVRLSAIAVNR